MKNPAGLYIKIIVLILCVFAVKILCADSDLVKVEFSFESAQAKNVSVAGSFNNWSAGNNVLEKNGSLWKAVSEILHYVQSGNYFFEES